MKAASLSQRISDLLAERGRKGLLRVLSQSHGADFSSNDYLGLARSPAFAAIAAIPESRDPPAAAAAAAPLAPVAAGSSITSTYTQAPLVGSTGSRLLSGNSPFYEHVEAEVARFHGAAAGLIFNSGFDANLGFFGCVPQAGDHVFYDSLIHASVHEGMKVGRAATSAFAHNDVTDLRRQIQGVLRSLRPGDRVPSILVAVETVYSMDGDVAPLAELVQICSEFGAHLVVDEAHATGVYGPKGAGRVQELGLEAHVFARLHTFGKALGCHGAIILGSQDLRSYLVNYARPLIYSTSLPTHSLLNIQRAYALLQAEATEVGKLRELIRLFRSRLGSLPAQFLLPSTSPIQGVVVPGNNAVVAFAKRLQAAGFDVKPIRSPTVPAGTERVRICIHAHNTVEEVESLTAHILKFMGEGSKL